MNENYLEMVQKEIGYIFKNVRLLEQAFIRKSYANEHNEKADNELLEFIGDKALDTAVIGILNAKYAKIINSQVVSDLTEGDFTELKKKLVDKKNLSKRMDILGYHQHLKMGKGDILKKVQEDDSVKEDLFEAIIGAVWIDSDHDFKIIKKVVEVMLDTSSFFDNAQENEDENYIGLLQEWCQKKHFDIPVYEITPLQNGRFGCTCFVDAIEEPV
jgi:ribonuclease-3